MHASVSCVEIMFNLEHVYTFKNMQLCDLLHRQELSLNKHSEVVISWLWLASSYSLLGGWPSVYWPQSRGSLSWVWHGSVWCN